MTWLYAQTDMSRVVDGVGAVAYIACLVIVISVVAQKVVEAFAFGGKVGNAELFSFNKYKFILSKIFRFC